MYKAIGFDYGGVIKGRPGIVFLEEVCALLGITKERYHQVYYRHNKKINRGEITWPELWHLVLGELGHEDKIDQVMAISDDVFNGKINNDILELVDALRTVFKVGLLSNNTVEAARSMEQLGMQHHFDVVQVSAITGLVKPEPSAFEHFAAALHVELSELVFIDDSARSLSTAEECGFMPILFESYEQLVAKLKDLGVIGERGIQLP